MELKSKDERQKSKKIDARRKGLSDDSVEHPLNNYTEWVLSLNMFKNELKSYLITLTVGPAVV